MPLKDVSLGATIEVSPSNLKSFSAWAPSGQDFLKGAGKTLLRPLVWEPGDGWIILTATMATLAALQTDVQTHRVLAAAPDPSVGGKRLSFWVTQMGEGLFTLGVVVIAGLSQTASGLRIFWSGLQALLAVAIASQGLKLIFREERPDVDPNHIRWFSNFNASAMPSGHTMSAFALAAILGSEWPYLAPVFYGLAVWVGLSRVQLSRHWLSNVVVGAALGTLFGLQAYRLTRKIELSFAPWTSQDGAGLNVGMQF